MSANRHENPTQHRGIYLTLDRVSKTYQRGQETVTALRDCSLTFAPGQLTLVLGPSGGGKSTMLHLLGGMDRPSSGRIVADGVEVTALNANRLAQWRRQTVGFVFQNFYLLPGLSAAENVALPLLLDGQSRPTRLQRARELLTEIGLGDRSLHSPGQLSGGQIQRVAVARALCHDAPVILADEPTGNLDTDSGQAIMSQLRALAHDDGRTVIVVSHNPDYAAFADRVLRIRDGQIEEDTRPVHVKTAPPLSAVDVRGTGPRWISLLGQALRSLSRRRARGILTGVGVMIGVTSMVLLISLGAGLQSKVVSAVTGSTSLNMITVTPSSQQTASLTIGPIAQTGGVTHPIGPASIRRFDHMPHVRASYGVSQFLLNGTAGNRTSTLVVESLPPSVVTRVSRPSLVQGQYPSRRLNGLVLPERQARMLFGGHGHWTTQKAIGRTVHVTITGQVSGTTITGAANPLSPLTLVVRGISRTSLNSSVYVNAALADHWLALMAGKHRRVHYPSAIVVSHGISHVSDIAARLRHQGYGVTTTAAVIHKIQGEFSVVETGLGIVGGIALAVAGLMIAVVMSMAVLERRREIGVWRALGARRRDVFVLFLVEAVLVGLAGGILGDVSGWALGQLGAVLFHQTGLFLVPLWLTFLGLVFGGGVAAIAGAIPANHAARLRPVDALRAE